MRKAGHIRKRVYSSKLDFTIVKKAQVWPQPMAPGETRCFKAEILFSGHYGWFSGKIFAPTKEPHRNPISLPDLAAKLDKFIYTHVSEFMYKKTTRQETQGNIFLQTSSEAIDKARKGRDLELPLTGDWRAYFWQPISDTCSQALGESTFQVVVPS